MNSNKLRSILVEKRDNILSELMDEQNILDHTSSYVEDIGEIAFDQSDKRVFSALSQQQRNMLNEIDSALNRMNNGTYGICVQCLSPIEYGRLELVPFTQFCSEHKNS